MNSIGLFFGSFNPVHNGHLAIARYLLCEGYCEEVWFIISPHNPWKEDSTLLDEQKRYEIVQKAIAGDERMTACDIEFTMPRPSYTYQTLRALKEKYPEKEFSLIIGGDNMSRFHLWKNYEEIITRFRILVYPRPGIDMGVLSEPCIALTDAPLTPVSSTEIRQRIKTGEDVSGFVPMPARELIVKYYSGNVENIKL